MKVGSTSIAYDALGNPTTYNGYALTWEGRQLMEMSMAGGQFRYTFEYNDEGIRTAKYSNGTWHYYTLEGSRIVTESIGSKLLVYLYDESGSPIGLQYRQSSYAANQYDTFFFEKNIFGDIVAVYNEDGDKIGSYTYDAWGNFTVSTESGITVTERNIVRTYNPFRYRGYYYDTDTGLYYLQSRYYNPQWGRFLNADGYVSTGQGLLGYNMYAYCNNNPVMLMDSMGNRAERVVRVNGGVTADRPPSAIRVFMNNIISDVQAFDIHNDSEEVVLDSYYFSAYQKTLVIRLPIGTNAFSLGIIFLGDEVATRSDSIETVRHEYGHIIQLHNRGWFGYIEEVGIPSLTAYLLDSQDNLPYDYHSAPWEAEANENVGVVYGPFENPWTEAHGYYDIWDLLEQVYCHLS